MVFVTHWDSPPFFASIFSGDPPKFSTLTVNYSYTRVTRTHSFTVYPVLYCTLFILCVYEKTYEVRRWDDRSNNSPC